MKLASAALLTLSWIAAPILRAQDQPPVNPPPAAAPAPPPVLEYTGKPTVLPFQCTHDDIEWGGLGCTEEEPCAMYLELTAVESSGGRIIAAGDIHSSRVTLYSILLASEDGGHTWSEAAGRIRGAGLDHVEFLDAATGWASGQVLVPLPQDPFLLLTTDAGKSWRQRAVFGDSRENRFGAIQQFFFSAKDSGSLIVDRGQGSDGDRYELYESPDGGESWTMKETSNKPLRLKRAAAPSTDWRVRADGPTQAFDIEHRQGQRWIPVAAFAVKLAACKPPSEP